MRLRCAFNASASSRLLLRGHDGKQTSKFVFKKKMTEMTQNSRGHALTSAQGQGLSHASVRAQGPAQWQTTRNEREENSQVLTREYIYEREEGRQRGTHCRIRSASSMARRKCCGESGDTSESSSGRSQRPKGANPKYANASAALSGSSAAKRLRNANTQSTPVCPSAGEGTRSTASYVFTQKIVWCAWETKPKTSGYHMLIHNPIPLALLHKCAHTYERKERKRHIMCFV